MRNEMYVLWQSQPHAQELSQDVERAGEGDWIIREAGTTDKAYPCKPDVFARKYRLKEQKVEQAINAQILALRKDA